MNSEWPVVRLGDYCLKIGSGATPRGGKSVYLDAGETTLIRSQNIYNDGFTADGLVYITKSAADKLNNVEVLAGDILLNITGDSVARVCIAPTEYLPARVNQHVSIIRPDPEDFDARFLRYFLVSPEQQELLLIIASAGATRNALTKGHIESLEISKPSLAIQTGIADQLETLDKKIEINHQINQTLEQMAQAIFKSWFVDFEPVKAKIAALEAGGSEDDALLAAMQVISGKDPQQLTQLQTENPEHYATLRATAALFPAAMQESELAEIPEGWEASTLADFADLNKNSWTAKTLPSEIDYVDLANTKNGVIESTTKYLSGDAPSRARRKLLNGDTIIGTVRPGNRSFAFIKQPSGSLTGSTGFAVLSPKCPEFAEYIYIAATSDAAINHLAHLADGGAYPAVRSEVVAGITVIVPHSPVLICFHEMVRPYFDISASLKIEIKSLAELRDTLLPKLLSGELKVNDESHIA